MKKKLKHITSYIFLTFLIISFVFSISSLSAIAAEVVVIPLIKNHVSAISPSEVIELHTSVIAADNTIVDFYEFTPLASNAGVYTVPTGKYLVITSITINPQQPGVGLIYMELIQNNAIRYSWRLPNSQPTSLSFGPGMLIAPDFSPKIRNAQVSAGSIKVDIYGYETNE